MNLESLKLGFQSYIEEKLAESGKDIQEQNTLKDSDISIFMYSNEFKDYLVEEVGADVSIFSKSLSEIMSMDFVDGKFVEPEDSNSDTFESENSSSIITDLVNSALGNENVINALDTDKSGNLGIMSSLVREQVGKFELSQCQTLEEIEEKGAHLYSISEALAHLPRIDLEDDFDVKCGKHLRFDTDADRIVLYYENQAMAVYERHHGNVFACARGLWS